MMLVSFFKLNRFTFPILMLNLFISSHVNAASIGVNESPSTTPVTSKTTSSKIETPNNQPVAEPTTLEKIKILKMKGDLNSAKSLANAHLKKYPDDVDVMLLLGFIDYQQSNYSQAEAYFRKVLEKSPTYLDAKIGLIRIKIIQKKFSEALKLIKQAIKQDPTNPSVKEIQIFYKKAVKAKQNKIKNKKQISLVPQPSLIDQLIEKWQLHSAMIMVNEQLAKYPNDPKLLVEKGNILFLKHLYSQSAYYSKKAIAANPEDRDAKALLSNIKEIDPHKVYGLNEIGLSTFNQYASDITQIWDYSTLYYSRETSMGSVMGKINSAKRLRKQALQGELELFPVINPYFYLDIDGTVANQPVLFPKYALSVEGYGTIPAFSTLSLGGNYNYIAQKTYYRKYTASISKDINKYWLSMRVNYYNPNAGEKSTLYIATIRRYFNTNDFYLNFTLGMGKSPDLADLEAVNFIVINNKFANLSLRFPIFNSRTLVDAGIDYENWKYPSGRIRNLYGVNLGLNYRF